MHREESEEVKDDKLIMCTGKECVVCQMATERRK